MYIYSTVCWTRVSCFVLFCFVLLSCVCGYGVDHKLWSVLGVHFSSLVAFWGAKGAPILFSEIGFCIASCSYICMYIYICQDGGAVGFVEFTKLLFALSSLAQPLKRVRSIP